MKDGEGKKGKKNLGHPSAVQPALLIFRSLLTAAPNFLFLLRSVHSSFSSLDLHFARLMEKLSGSGDPLLRLLPHWQAMPCRRAMYALTSRSMPCSRSPSTIRRFRRRWPDLVAWTDALAASPVVGYPGRLPAARSFGSRLYLYRYWDYEQRLIARLRDRCTGIARDFDHARCQEPL